MFKDELQPFPPPPPPPADVIVEKVEGFPFPPSAQACVEPLPGVPPPPTVIGNAVAVTEIFPAPSKGDAV